MIFTSGSDYTHTAPGTAWIPDWTGIRSLPGSQASHDQEVTTVS